MFSIGIGEEGGGGEGVAGGGGGGRGARGAGGGDCQFLFLFSWFYSSDTHISGRFSCAQKMILVRPLCFALSHLLFGFRLFVFTHLNVILIHSPDPLKKKKEKEKTKEKQKQMSSHILIYATPFFRVKH